MADLPPARLKVYDLTFSHVGVDYFGPFLTKVKRSEVKRTDTARAIHLEMAQDLTMSPLLMHYVDLWPEGAQSSMHIRIMEPT